MPARALDVVLDDVEEDQDHRASVPRSPVIDVAGDGVEEPQGVASAVW
jgi:hypothetical protein